MKTMLRRVACSALSIAGIYLAGCSGTTDTTNNPPVPIAGPPAIIVPSAGTQPLFDPASGDPGKIPLPNDLLRNPQTGFVDQIPNTPPFNAEPFSSLRTIRGFSTSGNILIPFTGGIDPASVNSQSVRMVNVSNTTARVDYTNTVFNPLVTNVTTNSTIVLTPSRPLAPNSTHIVVITSQVTGVNGSVTSTPTITFTKVRTPLVVNGVSQVTGLTDAQATALEPLRLAYQPIWTAAEQITNTDRANIPFAFSFGTEPEFVTLPALQKVAVAQNRGVGPTAPIAANSTIVQGFYNTTLQLPAVAAANVGRIFTGNISMPDYIGTPVNSSFFQGTGAPGDPVVSKGDRNVPFICCLPDPAVAPGPRPCIIFSPGITRTKNDIFAIASTACSAGFGIIAIDHTLHGSLDPINTIPPSNISFNLAQPSPGTGSAYVNIASPRTFRDNVRQDAVDYFYLTQAIVSGQTNFDGVAGPELAPLPPAWLGTSLGGIVGTIYSSCDPSSRLGVYNVPGGPWTTLAANSPTFGPPIAAGLAQNGIVNGTAAWTQFLLIQQTVLDDADPFNYGAQLNAGTLKAGNTTTSLMQYYLGDQVVPNIASEYLARSILAPQVSPVLVPITLLDTVTAPFRGSGVFQFPNTSQHGAILTPAQGATTAIRTQAFTFIGTGFAATSNATIIAPANVNVKVDNGDAPQLPADLDALRRALLLP